MTREEAKNYLENYRKTYADLAPERFLEALDIILSDPSLPSNLDEAAEKSGLEYAPIISGEALDLSGQVYETDDINWPDRCGFIKGFKAGAEWMAGQGHTVEGTFHHSCGYPSVIELKTYIRDYEGADVIVQIRKKQ